MQQERRGRLRWRDVERVLDSASLAGDSLRRVSVAGTSVMLGRLADGTVVAFSSNCPHQRTDLGRATFVEGVVQCTLHGYCYDTETGENVYPAGEVDPAELWRSKPGYLPVYPVEERDGWIWVGAEPCRRRRRTTPSSSVRRRRRPRPTPCRRAA